MSQVWYTTQSRQQLPADLDWLTPGERERLEGFRFDKRRRDWLLGRWTAKIALLGISGLSERDIQRFEIDSAPNGAPLPRLDGQPYQVGLSLSHSHELAFSAVSRDADALGCDIELVEPRSDVFVETWFTEAERVCVENASPSSRDSLVTMIWSAKESTLKALQTGLQVDTRSVEVLDRGERVDQVWGVARTVTEEAGEFSCLWRPHGEFILTIATRDPVGAPVEHQ